MTTHVVYFQRFGTELLYQGERFVSMTAEEYRRALLNEMSYKTVSTEEPCPLDGYALYRLIFRIATSRRGIYTERPSDEYRAVKELTQQRSDCNGTS